MLALHLASAFYPCSHMSVSPDTHRISFRTKSRRIASLYLYLPSITIAPHPCFCLFCRSSRTAPKLSDSLQPDRKARLAVNDTSRPPRQHVNHTMRSRGQGVRSPVLLMCLLRSLPLRCRSVTCRFRRHVFVFVRGRINPQVPGAPLLKHGTCRTFLVDDHCGAHTQGQRTSLRARRRPFSNTTGGSEHC